MHELRDVLPDAGDVKKRISRSLHFVLVLVLVIIIIIDASGKSFSSGGEEGQVCILITKSLRSMNDRRRFFEIARGSSMECAATLDVIGVYKARNSEEINRGKALLYRIVAMLSKMTETTRETVCEQTTPYGFDEQIGVDYDYEHEHDS